ncbi:hypothetical protein EDD21DRAFT_361202 [Dissophora ornata]|nr:hypothetical protein BGZ58_009889 [Dissophora ornata]KAI8606313.1 hypothetical protein EDD21DRAFT_361202 [Dissophora ornata]
MESTIRHSPLLGSPDDQSPVKGILKKTTSSCHQPDENTPRLKWDEENLIITEAQKDSTMKIDEPKTPYVHYNYELDRVMEPDEVFALEGPRKKAAALAHTPPVPSYLGGLDDEDDDEEEEGDDVEQDPEEWQDSEDEEDDDAEDSGMKSVDHDKFAKMRAQHYKMKEAVHLGRHFVDEDEEDDEEEEEEEQRESGKILSGSGSRSPISSVSIVSGSSCSGNDKNSNIDNNSSSASTNTSRRTKDDDEVSLDMEL